MKNIILSIFILFLCINSCNAVTTDDWQDYVRHKIANENAYIEKQNKRNVYLYYEIYDAFCRKYGYKYTSGSYETTVPAKVEKVDRFSSSISDYEYQNFYNKYKDYITNQKAPDSTFYSALRNLGSSDEKIRIVPEHKESHYYIYLKVNASEAAKKKEVDDVYLAKKSKVKPMPYSVVNTVSKYKVLKKDDVKMILEHLQERLNIISIDLVEGISVGKTIMTDKDIEDIYFIYEHQPEKFRSYAKTLDEKYSQYYVKD